MDYIYGGYTVRCSIDLPLLPAPSSSFEILSIEHVDAQFDPHAVTWFRQDSSEQVCQQGEIAGVYVIYFPDVQATYFLDWSAKVLRFSAKSGSFERAIHLLLNVALPTFLSIDPANVVLHGSAVEIGGRAVCFLGETGSGKSSIATRLCLMGCRLLADDGVLLRLDSSNWLVYPSYPVIRLWEDSQKVLGLQVQTCEAKGAFNSEELGWFSGDAQVGLGEIYILNPVDSADTAMLPVKITGGAAVKNLSDFVFSTGEHAMGNSARIFKLLSELAASNAIFTLPSPDSSEAQNNFCSSLMG